MWAVANGLLSNARHLKSHPLCHENQLGLPDFSACNVENTRKSGDEATKLLLLVDMVIVATKVHIT